MIGISGLGTLNQNAIRTPIDFAAQNAGFYDDLWRPSDRWVRIGGLARFAEAVREIEREACAQEFDRRAKPCTGFYEPDEPAQIIRARSK